ncbi:MAG: hypothetical protein IJW55_03930 [Clostridia bacterium]|nr:hypothetical protein [Clostridia bacterium]
MKKLLLLLLALSMVIGLAGCKNTPEEPPVTEPTVFLELVKNKTSDYVIVYSSADKNGSALADRIWSLFDRLYGVSLKLRDDSSSYEHEILVGNTNRDATSRVQATLTASDFAMMQDGDDLILLSTDATMTERLVLTLERLMTESAASGSFTFTDLNNYLYSQNPDAAASGDEVILLENGASQYTIVYSEAQEYAHESASYLSRQFKLKTGVSLPISTDAEEHTYEILIGSGVSRSETKAVNAMLAGNNDFAICVSGTRLIVSATDNEALFKGLKKLLEEIAQDSTDCKLSEADNYLYSGFGRDYTIDLETFITEYQKVYNTYASSFEYLYATQLSLSTKSDQELIEALVERMGNGAAFYIGSSSVLYQGYKQKLDPSDYHRAAKVSGGKVLIPADFAEKYFGKTLTKTSDNYVDISSLCAGSGDVSLYYDSAKKLAILTPSDVVSFSESGKINGYTNAQYLQRMIEFFTDTTIEPANNSEQSRVVIASSEYLRDNPDYTTKTYTACASPSITTVTENGKTVLYVTYEMTLTKHTLEELDTVTYIKKSTDNGVTWTAVGQVDDLRWGSAFTLNNEVWLLGNNVLSNNAMIAHVTSGGKVESATLMSGVGGGGPTTVLVANGRVYKAYNDRTVSAPVNANLLSADSWTLSNRITGVLDAAWLKSASGKAVTGIQTQECNLLIGPDGAIYNVMRIEGYVVDSYGNNNNILGAGYAAILKLSDDGSTYTVPESGALIKNFPTGVSKFSIRYDEASGKYICVSNLYTGAKLLNQRTVMVISTSTDLLNWETKDALLVEREMINRDVSAFAHGWHYADFVTVDGDLYYVVRESVGDANDWHTGNYIGFYTLEDYQSVIS